MPHNISKTAVTAVGLKGFCPGHDEKGTGQVSRGNPIEGLKEPAEHQETTDRLHRKSDLVLGGQQGVWEITIIVQCTVNKELNWPACSWSRQTQDTFQKQRAGEEKKIYVAGFLESQKASGSKPCRPFSSFLLLSMNSGVELVI